MRHMRNHATSSAKSTVSLFVPRYSDWTMSSSLDNCVIFDGTKAFWETRKFLKIVIVSHPKHSCVEIIANDPIERFEFPRIYLDLILLISKVESISDKTCVSVKDLSINNENDIKTQMMMEYAYARINLTLNTTEDRNCQLVLQPSYDDVLIKSENGSMKIDFERPKPDDLTPFKVIENSPFISRKVEDISIDMKENEDVLGDVNNAGKSLNLISTSMQGFFAAYCKNRYFNTDWSVPRKRWVRAIRKVIIQNYIKSVTTRLAAPQVSPPAILPLTTEKIKVLGKKKMSFCDEHMGLSSGSKTVGRHSAIPLHLQNRPQQTGKTNFMALAFRNVGRIIGGAAASQGAEFDDIPQIQEEPSQQLPLAPSSSTSGSSRHPTGTLRRSFDDSNIMENTTSAASPTPALSMSVPTAVVVSTSPPIVSPQPVKAKSISTFLCRSPLTASPTKRALPPLMESQKSLRSDSIDAFDRPSALFIPLLGNQTPSTTNPLGAISPTSSMSRQASLSPTCHSLRALSSDNTDPLCGRERSLSKSLSSSQDHPIERPYNMSKSTSDSMRSPSSLGPLRTRTRTSSFIEAESLGLSLSPVRRSSATVKPPPCGLSSPTQQQQQQQASGGGDKLFSREASVSDVLLNTPRGSTKYLRGNSAELRASPICGLSCGNEDEQQSDKAGGIASIQHANHTPGLKLVKRVGTFQYTESQHTRMPNIYNLNNNNNNTHNTKLQAITERPVLLGVADKAPPSRLSKMRFLKQLSNATCDDLSDEIGL